jgi:uncharacterized protein
MLANPALLRYSLQMIRVMPRFAEGMIADALDDTRVVIVNGARQSGKSTVVAAATKKRRNVVMKILDRPNELAASKADPEGFVEHDGLMVIDEIQRAPGIILPIKARVDQNQRPGQFLLTGSARILGLKSLPDALVGRAETIELWPFSQREIQGDGLQKKHAVDAMFHDAPKFPGCGVAAREDYIARALRGGFPEATKRAGVRRDRFFEAYVRDLIDRDVAQLSEIERRTDLIRLIRLLASRQATLLKIEELSSALGLPARTLDRYVSLLEQVFLLKRIPAWSSSRTARAVRMQKLLIVDSGIAAHLNGTTERRLLREPALFGPLLENFVLSEVARQLSWCTTPLTLFHYRTRDGEEVDGLLEANDGRLVGIEVKASASVSAQDFRHLVHLQSRTVDDFHLGIVFYTGKDVLSFGPRLRAVPIDALWETGKSRT